VAIVGQSAFGAEVYKLIQSNGHTIVGVFTIPDVKGKEDILGKKVHVHAKCVHLPNWDKFESSLCHWQVFTVLKFGRQFLCVASLFTKISEYLLRVVYR
jgi:hypothetical protein